jgi:carboxypeptidase D
MMFPRLLFSLFAAGALCVAPGVDAHKMTKPQIKARQAEAAQRWRTLSAAKGPSSGGVKNITFSNPKASRKHFFFNLVVYQKCRRSKGSDDVRVAEFWVDGSKIPQVDFDIGPSWSGLLPISNNPGETRKVHILLCMAKFMM